MGCLPPYHVAMRRLHQDTHSLIARTGMSLTEFAATADIDRAILYRIWRPVRESTAWRIAKAYATAASLAPEQAYAEIIIEEPAG